MKFLVFSIQPQRGASVIFYEMNYCLANYNLCEDECAGFVIVELV